MVNKKSLLIFTGLFLIFCSYSVMAATTLVSPVANGNYSTLIFNCTTDLVEPLNATLYYNASGGAATTALVTMINDTDGDTEFYNASANIASLNDLDTYNMTCAVDNSTDIEYSVSAASITIDSTVPNVSTFYNTVNAGSYSDTTILNVSVSDALMGIDSVYFNVTYPNGTQLNFTKATNTSIYYNISLDTSGFVDGNYNITVFANDTQLNNLNNSEHIQITIDNTHPSVSLASSSSSRDSLTLTITGADGTCTASGTGTTSISGATLTVTGLNCGTSYAYVVTCVDAASNSGASSSTSFTTSSCGSSASSTQGYFWSNTYVPTGEQFQKGYTKELGIRNRVRVNVNGEEHHVGIKELTGTTATIEIASDPIEVTLSIGEEKKFDVTGDGFYDIYVVLNGISSNKADVTIQTISEEISTEDTETLSGDEESITDKIVDKIPEVAKEKSFLWLWILLGLILAIVLIRKFVPMEKVKEFFNKYQNKVKVLEKK